MYEIVLYCISNLRKLAGGVGWDPGVLVLHCDDESVVNGGKPRVSGPKLAGVDVEFM